MWEIGVIILGISSYSIVFFGFEPKIRKLNEQYVDVDPPVKPEDDIKLKKSAVGDIKLKKSAVGDMKLKKMPWMTVN